MVTQQILDLLLKVRVLPGELKTVWVDYRMDTIERVPERVFFGGTFLFRVWCSKCKEKSLVTKGLKLCCCGEQIENPTEFVQYRESTTEFFRSPIPDSVKKELLDWQKNICIYCGSSIDLNCHVDHFIPWVYSGDNHSYNFFAACPECNQIKNDKVFDDVETARKYICEIRASRGMPTKTRKEIFSIVFENSENSNTITFPSDIAERVFRMKRCLDSLKELKGIDRWGRPRKEVDPEKIVNLYSKFKSIRAVSKRLDLSRSIVFRAIKNLLSDECKIGHCQIHHVEEKKRTPYNICSPYPGICVKFVDDEKITRNSLIRLVHDNYYYVDLVFILNGEILVKEHVPHHVIRFRVLKDIDRNYWFYQGRNASKEVSESNFEDQKN